MLSRASKTKGMNRKKTAGPEARLPGRRSPSPPKAMSDTASRGYSKVSCIGIVEKPTEPAHQGAVPVGGFKRWPACRRLGRCVEDAGKTRFGLNGFQYKQSFVGIAKAIAKALWRSGRKLGILAADLRIVPPSQYGRGGQSSNRLRSGRRQAATRIIQRAVLGAQRS